MAAVVGLVKDVLDRSRIQGVARAVGSSVAFASTLAELAESELGDTTTVFVDLTDEDLEGIRVPEVVGRTEGSSCPRTIGFVSHQDRERVAEAEAAGFDEVLTRAAFFGRLSVLLAQARDRESKGGEPEGKGTGGGA